MLQLGKIISYIGAKVKIIFFIIFFSILFNGCGNSSEGENRSSGLSGYSIGERGFNTNLAINYCQKSSNLFFDKINPSYYISNNSNIYSDKGHYRILFQSKDSSNKMPIGKNCVDLSNLTIDDYTLYENNNKIPPQESKVIIKLDPRVSEILLLLDFSGSIISDCDDTTKPISQNSCKQLVNAVKSFIDYIIDNNHQKIAIYYFNSEIQIFPLATSTMASATDDKKILKDGIEKLFDKNFRDNYLKGYNSTNLYGAVIEATKVACHWVNACNYDIYTPVKNSFKFASIVTFTDSKDLAHRATLNDMISFKNKHSKLYYYAIGIIGADGVDVSILKDVGRPAGIGYVYNNSLSNLNDAFGEVAKDLDNLKNSYYSLDYCPASQQGKINIRLKIQKANKDGKVFQGELFDNIEIPANTNFKCDLE